jgi:predicted CXXCH cytochrome family protein
MKEFKMFKKLAGLFAVITAGLFGVSTSMAGTIDDSAHDFAGGSWVSTDEICVVCHAPHDNAGTALAGGLLWNHSASTIGDAYTLYTGQDMSDTPGQPTGTSKLCLSCHDGLIAIDSYGGSAGAVGASLADGVDAAFVGTDLSDDHPISFTYPTTSDPATGDAEIYLPGTTVTIGDTTQATGTIDDLLLDGGVLQCASCHDVHNTLAVADTKLLYKSNVNSGLCLMCHNK